MLRLLKRGLDPNESENYGRTALHIAASNGSEQCVQLLLKYGADPDCRDNNGSIPLWDATKGGHEEVVKILHDHGANICAGNVGQYAYIAIEQDNLDLLKKIILYGGDITVPASPLTCYNGSTALYVALCDENIEMVKYLLDQGAHIDMPHTTHGWTPQALAEQQGHKHLYSLFRAKVGPKPQELFQIPEEPRKVYFLGRYKSKPNMHHITTREQSNFFEDGSVGSIMRPWND